MHMLLVFLSTTTSTRCHCSLECGKGTLLRYSVFQLSVEKVIRFDFALLRSVIGLKTFTPLSQLFGSKSNVTCLHVFPWVGYMFFEF